MQGHTAVNLIPIVPANRIGKESEDGVTLDFDGTSFICNHRAEIVADAGRDVEGIALSTLDFDLAAKNRVQWGTFQTRRPQNHRVLVDTPSGPPPS